MNTDIENDTNSGEVLIYDVNGSAVDASSILHITQFKKVGVGNFNIDTEIHKSALEFPGDVDAYIVEELELSALLGPFSEPPIPSSHCSPFMTQAKPNSDRGWVIIDMS